MCGPRPGPRLRHPNVVTIDAVVVEPKQFRAYVQMPYCSAGTMSGPHTHTPLAVMCQRTGGAGGGGLTPPIISNPLLITGR